MEATGLSRFERRKGRVLRAQDCLQAALEILKGEVLNEERLPAGSSATFTQLTKLRASTRAFMEQLDTVMERRALRIEAERDSLQVQYENLADEQEDFLSEQCKRLKEDLDSHHARSLEQHEQAMAKSTEKIARLEQERYALSLDKNGLIAQQSSLQQQLKDEREKLLCSICLDKPRDTLVMPCLHFQYCFSCLMKHRNANSNTCPTCRGDIQGLCMSSFLSNP